MIEDDGPTGRWRPVGHPKRLAAAVREGLRLGMLAAIVDAEQAGRKVDRLGERGVDSRRGLRLVRACDGGR